MNTYFEREVISQFFEQVMFSITDPRNKAIFEYAVSVYKSASNSFPNHTLTLADSEVRKDSFVVIISATLIIFVSLPYSERRWSKAKIR